MVALLINDIHREALHELKIDVFEEIRQFREKFPKGVVIANGDNGDRKGAKKNRLWAVDAFLDRLREVCDYFNNGNHELEFEYDQVTIIDGNLIIHGHQIYWDQDKIEKWRNKTPGRGSFMRALSWFYSHWRMIKQPKIKDIHMRRAVELCKKYNCHTVHTGHRHSREIISRTWTWSRVTVVSYPRGCNVAVLKGAA